FFVFTSLADSVQFLLNLSRSFSEPFERLASCIPSSMTCKPGWRFRGEEHAKKEDRAGNDSYREHWTPSFSCGGKCQVHQVGDGYANGDSDLIEGDECSSLVRRCDF